jgi:hypothetical protein
MDLLMAVAVRVVTVASHITQIFQLLDLTLFGIFKQEARSRLPFDERTTTANFVDNLYIKLATTHTAQNIWAANHAVGVACDTVRLLAVSDFIQKS